jgi:hypothetical protein
LKTKTEKIGLAKLISSANCKQNKKEDFAGDISTVVGVQVPQAIFLSLFYMNFHFSVYPVI